MDKSIKAGIAVRRMIRRFLLENEIKFTEEKGWIDSVFYCKCSDQKFLEILSTLNKWKRDLLAD